MKRVHVVIDEAASVGHLESLEDALNIGRGYGVRLQFYFQSPGQLKNCFPEDEGRTLLSNTNQVYFGVCDYQTAEAVSARIGESTIIVESGGTSSGTSTSWSMGAQGQEGGGTSHNASTNWSQQARKLVKPEEVLTESLRTAFTFVPGLPPIRTTLLRYYEEEWLRHPPGRIKQFLTASFVLSISATMCALSLALAVWISPPWARQWLGSFVSW